MKFLFLMMLVACATKPTPSPSADQFFKGKVQRTSMRGEKYGPAFESFVRRTVIDGQFTECVYQEGKAYTVTLAKTANPTVFDVTDKLGYSTGKMIYADERMHAWRYDIQVLRPNKGKITGTGSFKADGGITTKKMWNNELIILEDYKLITRDEYMREIPASVTCP